MSYQEEQCMITFKGRHTPKPIIRQCVHWYCSYALSYRSTEETESMCCSLRAKAGKSTLAGIALVAMPKKGQMRKNMVGALSPAEQFYALAA